MLNFITSDAFKKQRYLLEKTFHEVVDFEYDGSVYIAGGACRSVFANEAINDLDLYFTSEDALHAFKNQVDKKYEVVYCSENAVSYRTEKNIKFQLIKKIYGTPQNVMAQFDFTICMCACFPKTNTFVMYDRFLEHLARREIVFNIDACYPINSLFRANKFIKRQYYVSAVEWIKIGLKCHSLNLKNLKEIKEQLDGIDTFFLKEFTDNLNNVPGQQYDFEAFVASIEVFLNDRYINE
jgi:hypothetical protein